MTTHRWVGSAVLLALAAPALQAEQTKSCPGGKIDVLDWLTLDSDLRGTKHMTGTGLMYTALWPDKLYWIKTSNSDTMDINLYDSNKVYLWYTELDWHQPYNYRKHSSNFNMPMANRCATPGYPGDQLYSSDSSYTTYINCNATQTNNINKAAFSFWGPYTAGHPGLASETWRTPIGGGIANSTPVYVIQYRYNCNKSYGNCADAEEYVLTQRYGLVRWERFQNIGGVLTSMHRVEFNTLVNGGLDPWVPCFEGGLAQAPDGLFATESCPRSCGEPHAVPYFDGPDADIPFEHRFAEPGTSN